MIRCLPKGICSWDFFLEGEGRQASLEIHWMGEQGSLIADGKLLDVRKHGMFSGHWTLEQGGSILASARKSSAFTRTFEIQDSRETLQLEAESAFRRRFRLQRPEGVIANIVPDHALTRRSNIALLAEDWDFPTIAFAFWLVVLCWRRAAASSSGGGS